jgi:2,5-furandicarboxylate decarboxylase 1
MFYRDFRNYLDALEAEGELLRIKREVDADGEISAVIRCAGEAAVLCERVRGHDIPVVGNVFGSVRKMELALGVPRDQLVREYLRRLATPIPPRIVERGPVKENVLLGDDVDLGRLPVPVVNPRDGGPYIDAGISILRDPEFGTNLSMQRLQVKGKRRTGIFAADVNNAAAYIRRSHQRRAPVEIAIALGCAPALTIASQAFSAIDVDEYDIAGALQGRPVDVVRGETVDLLVPAHAEIVIEGRVLPDLEPEGPFGEFSGYYAQMRERPILEVTALTYRDNPIFHTIYLGKPPTENNYLTSITKAADLYRLVKEVVAEVLDVYFPPAGCGLYHAVIKIRKHFEGEGKQALAAALASRIAIKQAVVVDHDIDIYDPHEVQWALATRYQHDVDSVVVTDAPGRLDPSMEAKHGRLLSSKLGMDATLPLVPLKGTFPETCDVDADLLAHVRANWPSYLTGADAPAPLPLPAR